MSDGTQAAARLFSTTLTVQNLESWVTPAQLVCDDPVSGAELETLLGSGEGVAMSKPGTRTSGSETTTFAGQNLFSIHN